jgi:hypothetical protein
MACGPGRPALGGRWVRLRGGRARPHRGPGMRLADRRGVGQGSDLQEQWWARQGLNLRLLPCQQTTGNRCAKRRCRRSALTVEVEVKRSLCVQLSALFKLRGGAVEPGQRPPMVTLTLSLSAPLEGDKTPAPWSFMGQIGSSSTGSPDRCLPPSAGGDYLCAYGGLVPTGRGEATGSPDRVTPGMDAAARRTVPVRHTSRRRRGGRGRRGCGGVAR